MAKKALITGISGQDGAYLARLLLEKNYEVYGSHRRNSGFHFSRLAELGIEGDVRPVGMEVLEFSNVLNVLQTVRPDEIYNFAAQSFVGSSFEQPLYTSDVNALGPLRLLEAVRLSDPGIRFYQASSSEMFGNNPELPKTEKSAFQPCSPYGVSKLFAHWTTINYRESYKLKAVSGILFNHESPLRGREFVTRKITLGLARIRHGHQKTLELGDLDAKRDWGFAGDYMEGVWRMLQQENPRDYVLATGENHSVREFAEKAAALTGFDLEWSGKGSKEKGIDRKSGKTIITINPKLYRPFEVNVLAGNPARARKELGWKRKTSFAQLVEMMVEADLARVANNALAA